MGILRRTERAMVRAMCGAKQNTEDMMDMLGLNQTIDKMTQASGVRWLGHVFLEKRMVIIIIIVVLL